MQAMSSNRRPTAAGLRPLVGRLAWPAVCGALMLTSCGPATRTASQPPQVSMARASASTDLADRGWMLNDQYFAESPPHRVLMWSPLPPFGSQGRSGAATERLDGLSDAFVIGRKRWEVFAAPRLEAPPWVLLWDSPPNGPGAPSEMLGRRRYPPHGGLWPAARPSDADAYREQGHRVELLEQVGWVVVDARGAPPPAVSTADLWSQCEHTTAHPASPVTWTAAPPDRWAIAPAVRFQLPCVGTALDLQWGPGTAPPESDWWSTAERASYDVVVDRVDLPLGHPAPHGAILGIQHELVVFGDVPEVLVDVIRTAWRSGRAP